MHRNTRLLKIPYIKTPDILTSTGPSNSPFLQSYYHLYLHKFMTASFLLLSCSSFTICISLMLHILRCSKCCKHIRTKQHFPNFFQVGTTLISQNVLLSPLLLSPLKANCLRFSTTVCDTQFTLI
jgi:hypothetical protein